MVANRVALRGGTAERIEALLSARLFLEPQLADDRLHFISNLGGALSLYAMDADGGTPEPLLPPKIALQNPDTDRRTTPAGRRRRALRHECEQPRSAPRAAGA